MILKYFFKYFNIHDNTHDFRYYSKDSMCGHLFRKRYYRCSKCGSFICAHYCIGSYADCNDYTVTLLRVNISIDGKYWRTISSKSIPSCNKIMMEKACG